MPGSEGRAAQEWLRRQSAHVSAHSTLQVSEETAATIEVEAWLQRRDVKYAPATGIPMAMIDERRSRSNQARKDALVPESVERFANSFREGRPFPPIVCYALGNRLVIIDGNNRHEAAKRAKREFIAGIIIDETTPSELIQLLTVEANNGHGVTPDKAWRIRQANHLVTLGFSDNKAAEASGVTALQMKNARAAAEASARARKLNVVGFDELSDSNKTVINVVKSDPVFLAAARLAVSQRLANDQLKDLLRAIKTGRSEAEMLAIVAEQAELFNVEVAAKRAEKRGVSSPKNALVSGVGLITKCDAVALVSQIMTVHDRDTIRRRLDEAVDKILAIQVEMEKLNGLED